MTIKPINQTRTRTEYQEEKRGMSISGPILISICISMGIASFWAITYLSSSIGVGFNLFTLTAYGYDDIEERVFIGVIVRILVGTGILWFPISIINLILALIVHSAVRV